MPVIVEFKECATCAAKPGRLCDSCLSNRRVIEKFKASLREKDKAEAPARKPSKVFRLKRLNITWINIDTDLNSRDEKTGMEDIVVSIIDANGNKFEVERFCVESNGLMGHSTATAQLVQTRSWGDEGKDGHDPSVTCPICLFEGHGAQVCKESTRGW